MMTYQKIRIYDEEWIPNTLNDEEQIYRLKEAIQQLRPVERKIFLTYVEGGTYTSVAKEYSVSVPTAKKYIQMVKNKINQIIEDNGDDNTPTTD